MMSCLSLLVVLPSLAQQPTGESATIQALLQEVRALRLSQLLLQLDQEWPLVGDDLFHRRR